MIEASEIGYYFIREEGHSVAWVLTIKEVSVEKEEKSNILIKIPFGSQTGQVSLALEANLCDYFGLFKRLSRRGEAQLNKRKPRVSSAKTSS